MKKITKYLAGGFMGLVGALGLSTQFAHAAADADLVAAGASTTAFFTDNKSTIVSTFITIVIAITIIGVSIALALRAKRMAVGVVSGGKRRR